MALRRLALRLYPSLATCRRASLCAGGVGDADAVEGGADDAAGVSRALPAGEESGELRVFEGVIAAGNSNGRAGARFKTDQQGLVRGVAAHPALEEPQSFAHPAGDPRRQEFVQRGGPQAGEITRLRQVRGDFSR